MDIEVFVNLSTLSRVISIKFLLKLILTQLPLFHFYKWICRSHEKDEVVSLVIICDGQNEIVYLLPRGNLKIAGLAPVIEFRHLSFLLSSRLCWSSQPIIFHTEQLSAYPLLVLILFLPAE